MGERVTVKVIAKSRPARAEAIAVLLATGLWDLVSMEDRRRFVEFGEVIDTPGGRLIFKTLRLG